MMKNLAVCVALAAGPAVAGEELMIEGRYTGEGRQEGTTWAMTVDFVRGAARVDYPEYPCGGVWVFASDMDASLGVERLTYGQDLCADGLQVRLVDTNGVIEVSWYEKGVTEIATGTLTKAGSPSGGRKSPGRN